MTFLFFATVLLLSLSACKKAEEMESTWVQVVAYGTQTPIPEARIKIQVWGESQGLFGLPTTVGEIFTDHEGKALIQNTFTEERVAAIMIYTDGRPYFDADVVYTDVQFFDFRDNPLIELYPISYVRLQVDWSIFEGEFDYVSTSPVPGCTPNDCMFIFNANTTQPTPPLRVYGNRMENRVLLTGYQSGGPNITFTVKKFIVRLSIPPLIF